MAERTSKAELQTLVDRLESLEEQKAEIAADVRSVYAEAEGKGFNPKALRAIVRLRIKGAMEEYNELQVTLEVYMGALGMMVDTPLGEAAIERAKAEFRKLPKRRDVAIEAGHDLTA
jgi:uncharacterized protein (UPF0335 family)